MTADPFFLSPTDAFGRPRRYLVHVSGGSTSGYLLRRILDAHGGTLPDHAVALFANTGKECEETLEFLEAMRRHWNVKITWVEYRHYPKRKGGIKDPKHDVAVVNFDTASRAGEPFESLIRGRQYLPNQHNRICTYELKVQTAARYAARRLGWRRPKPVSVLGIRADEPRRIRQAIDTECRTIYPLADAGVDLAAINAWWRSQPFRLELDRDKGNCDLCFLKGVRKVIKIVGSEPERAEWWQRMENFRADSNRPGKPELLRFRKDWSYAEISKVASSRLPFDIPDTDDSISCFCGD